MAPNNTASPLPAPFLASTLKLQRASKHVAELEAMVRDHLALLPPPAPPQAPTKNAEGRTVLHDHIFFHPPPAGFGAVVGDAVHNLRAALDLMAVDLVRVAGGNTSGVYFPFCDEPQALERTIRERHFDRAGEKAVALVKELQPYRNGNIALRAIHDLDIQDKHHTLIPVSTTATGQTFEFHVGDDGVTNLRAVPSAPATTVYAFPRDSPLAGKEIVPTLHELVKLTTCVVEAFAAL